MQSYLDTLRNILANGNDRGDRTGTGTRGVFGTQTRYQLQYGVFPAMTTKRLAWKAVVSELLWFIEGSGDERRLCEILHGTTSTDKKTIWTANAEADYWKGTNGDLGRVYGVQWRHWRSFKPLSHPEGNNGLVVGNYAETDQIANLVRDIKEDPYSRRHMLTAWNPGELDDMALPPCHILAQFYVTPYSDERVQEMYMMYRLSLGHDERNRLDAVAEGRQKTVDDLKRLGLPTGTLSCQMYQRSCDMFLGVPFNIASYALLTAMLAQVCNLEAGEFIHTLGDAHIYLNHMDQVKEQLTRDPLPLPRLQLNKDITSIFDFTMDDIELVDYQCHDAIKAPMAV